MRRRFFVDQIDAGAASLRGDAAHHLSRVLRVQPGQLYELSDGKAVWLGRVERASKNTVEFSLLEPILAREPALHCKLLLSIVKFDRFEWCLEKATELGVTEIVPLAAARSEKALVAAAGKRADRWRKILLESAQQSRRLRPPSLGQPVTTREMFSSLTNAGAAGCKESRSSAAPECRFLLSERSGAPSLKSSLHGRTAASCNLAVGPEGGWIDDEMATARAAGFEEVSLGENILRTETAVIAALAAINFALAE